MNDTLTLLEQATNAELAYYQQIELFDTTPEDRRSWQQHQDFYAILGPIEGAGPEQYTSRSYTRHVLERHGYSLHRYMARQLSPTAWEYWYAQGGILTSFRRLE